MIFERMITPDGTWWRQVKIIEADQRNNYLGAYRSGLHNIVAELDEWNQIIAPQIGCIGMEFICPRLVTEHISEWSKECPKGDLIFYHQAGPNTLAGIVNGVAMHLGRSLDEWIKKAEGLSSHDKHKEKKQWTDAAYLAFDVWKQAISLENWPRTPSAILAVEDGMCALDRMILKLLLVAQHDENVRPFLEAWIASRLKAYENGLNSIDHWRAWLYPYINDEILANYIEMKKEYDDPLFLDVGLLCPPIVELFLRVVKAGRKTFLMVRTPTVASSTIATLRKGLSPHARSVQRGPRAWELLDATGNKVAHTEGLDGGTLALLPAGALLRLVKDGNDKLRSPTGIRLILGICAIARQRAAGLFNASPHLIFNGLEDLVRQCGLPASSRNVSAARDVVAAGHVWHWVDERGGAAGLWTYTYRITGGTDGGRISHLTIVPGAPLIPTRGERGVLLAPLPMLGSLGAPRLVDGEAQLHLALCAEIQNASASLREGIGLVCEGETLERLARESGLKVEQVRAAIERWISEGVLSRETNGGVLWGEARAEARAFIIDQGEHRRAESERGKASHLKRQAAKK